MEALDKPKGRPPMSDQAKNRRKNKNIDEATMTYEQKLERENDIKVMEDAAANEVKREKERLKNMPNPKINKDDFDIIQSPEEIEEQKKRAEEAKKAAEESMRKQLEAFKQNREKWKKERLVDLETAKKALQDDLAGKISLKEFIKRTSGVFGTFTALWIKMVRRKREALFSQKINELDKAEKLFLYL